MMVLAMIRVIKSMMITMTNLMRIEKERRVRAKITRCIWWRKR